MALKAIRDIQKWMNSLLENTAERAPYTSEYLSMQPITEEQMKAVWTGDTIHWKEDVYRTDPDAAEYEGPEPRLYENRSPIAELLKEVDPDEIEDHEFLYIEFLKRRRRNR